MEELRGWFSKTGWFGLGVTGLALALVLVGSGACLAETHRLVDLNTASLEELSSLPGVGPVRARAIQERRSKDVFEAPEDLMEVPGIGSLLFERLRAHVVVGDLAGSKESRTGAIAIE